MGQYCQWHRTGAAHRSGALFGLTTNLLTTSSGAKMGKTAQGAVWLNADMLPVYDYWQFWRNTEDGDIGRFLRLFTELPETEITRLANWKGRSLTMPKRCWRPKPPPCAMVAMRRKKPKPQPVKLSRAAAKAPTCPAWRSVRVSSIPVSDFWKPLCWQGLPVPTAKRGAWFRAAARASTMSAKRYCPNAHPIRYQRWCYQALGRQKTSCSAGASTLVVKLVFVKIIVRHSDFGQFTNTNFENPPQNTRRQNRQRIDQQ